MSVGPFSVCNFDRSPAQSPDYRLSRLAGRWVGLGSRKIENSSKVFSYLFQVTSYLSTLVLTHIVYG